MDPCPLKEGAPQLENEDLEIVSELQPLPGSWDPPITRSTAQPIGAFEIPKSKRIRKFFSPFGLQLNSKTDI